jgi:ATP-dependent Clp protease ATP-binding subunit ClpC
VNSTLNEGYTITMDLDEEKNELTIKIKKGKKKEESRTDSKE